jgi:mannose-6-phosphate isomerase-like protein (cupin superfamily)
LGESQQEKKYILFFVETLHASPLTHHFELLLLKEDIMLRLIEKPSIITAAGNKPKIIEEYIGRVTTQTNAVSIARMKSPSGWIEPGQTPEFDEYTVVLKGSLRVSSKSGSLDIKAGQAVIVNAREWVQYSSPGADGAEYIAVCMPAFSPESVHRDM